MSDLEILSMVRNNVKKLTAYSTARDEFKGQASVFLDANDAAAQPAVTAWRTAAQPLGAGRLLGRRPR